MNTFNVVVQAIKDSLPASLDIVVHEPYGGRVTFYHGSVGTLDVLDVGQGNLQFEVRIESLSKTDLARMKEYLAVVGWMTEMVEKYTAKLGRKNVLHRWPL